MSKRLPVIVVYLVLLALALPIPFLHYYQTDRAIESLRPVMRLDDGSYAPMLMPMPILLLRWLGQLSRVIPCAILALFALSFWRESLSRFATVCGIAIGQCAFTTVYATYATLLFGFEWLHRTG
jgi:hypothetical protein